MKEIKNATFIQRLGAFIVDMIIIGLILSIFTTFTVDVDNYEKISNELVEIEEQYLNGDISPTTYISKSMDINYDISRETGLVSIIGVALSILYFVVYQVKKNGQTIGKKIFKIKLVSNNEKELNTNQVAVRSLIINSILADILLITLTLLGTKNIYVIGSLTVEFITYILLFISAIMVLSRKDKRGLHDIVANTKVIKEV